MNKQIVKIVMVIFCTLLSGCSSFELIPTTPYSHTTPDNISYILEPYTSELNDSYRYGYDYTNLAENTSFLLTVINNSNHPVKISDSIEAALVDGFGNQYEIVSKPSLPSIQSIKDKHQDALYNFTRNDEDILDENLISLLNRENELDVELADLYLQIESGNFTSTNATELLKKDLIILRQEIHDLRKINHNIKLKKVIHRKIKESYNNARFKGKILYPGARIYGLVVFHRISPEQKHIQILFPTPHNQLNKYIEFGFNISAKQ
jgi:hypothetical protein